MKKAVLSLLLAPAGWAQFTVGLKVGTPLTNAFEAVQASTQLPRRLVGFFSEDKWYLVGPTVELRLPAGLSIEADALYRRLGYGGDAGGTANQWEFPLLLKIKPGGRILRPFVDGGVAFNHISGYTQIGDFFRGERSPLDRNVSTGLVLGAGLEINAIIVRISPEARYIRWGWENFRDVNGLLRSNQSQAEFLVGFTF